VRATERSLQTETDAELALALDEATELAKRVDIFVSAEGGEHPGEISFDATAGPGPGPEGRGSPRYERADARKGPRPPPPRTFLPRSGSSTR
jgi:hypothetical protein